jgi:hypothetical protein
MTLDELLAIYEWFDNSRVSIIRGCKRKAFFQLAGPPTEDGQARPLASKVGDGANFGTAFHAGTNMYYFYWGRADEPTRRAHAARAFASEWGKYFPTVNIQSKHKLDNGLDILMSYFDQHLADDEHYRPVKGELGFACLFSPPAEDSFLYLGRIDGIFERLYDRTIWVRELKTVSGSVKDKLEQLKFSRQTLGYIHCLRKKLPDLHIAGAIPDVVLVASQKREAVRTAFHISSAEGASWERQLISTVADWRERVWRYRLDLAASGQKIALDLNFPQDTERCFDYGKCAFYDLCDYGLDPALVVGFESNTWNPITQGRPVDLEIYP